MSRPFESTDIYYITGLLLIGLITGMSLHLLIDITLFDQRHDISLNGHRLLVCNRS